AIEPCVFQDAQSRLTSASSVAGRRNRALLQYLPYEIGSPYDPDLCLELLCRIDPKPAGGETGLQHERTRGVLVRTANAKDYWRPRHARASRGVDEKCGHVFHIKLRL